MNWDVYLKKIGLNELGIKKTWIEIFVLEKLGLNDFCIKKIGLRFSY